MALIQAGSRVPMLSTRAWAMPTMSRTSLVGVAITGDAPTASSALALKFITTRLVMVHQRRVLAHCLQVGPQGAGIRGGTHRDRLLAGSRRQPKPARHAGAHSRWIAKPAQVWLTGMISRLLMLLVGGLVISRRSSGDVLGLKPAAPGVGGVVAGPWSPPKRTSVNSLAQWAGFQVGDAHPGARQVTAQAQRELAHEGLGAAIHIATR